MRKLVAGPGRVALGAVIGAATAALFYEGVTVGQAAWESSPRAGKLANGVPSSEVPQPTGGVAPVVTSVSVVLSASSASSTSSASSSADTSTTSSTTTTTTEAQEPSQPPVTTTTTPRPTTTTPRPTTTTTRTTTTTTRRRCGLLWC